VSGSLSATTISDLSKFLSVAKLAEGGRRAITSSRSAGVRKGASSGTARGGLARLRRTKERETRRTIGKPEVDEDADDEADET
jgi:hypothetical protein